MKLSGAGIYIRKLELADADEVLAYELRNRESFRPYEPTFRENRFTPAQVRGTLVRLQEEWEQDKCYAFGVFSEQSEEMIGRLALRAVVRGPAQQAQLGYTVDAAQHGKGIGTEAVRLALRFAFEHLKLHRIEAGVMPRNIGSNRLLEKVGFTKEGLNRKNVEICGQWEDHYLWAMLDSDWQERYGNGR